MGSSQYSRDGEPTGVGLGLRLPHLRQIANGEADGQLAFLEISPENFMFRGGTSPRQLAQIAERHSILTHGLMLSLGSIDPINPEYLSALSDFCRKYGGSWHSDHLCFSGHEGGLYHDLYPLPQTLATAKRVATRICKVRDKLGKQFAVENISSYITMGAPEMPDWEFLCEIQHRSQCLLLLDVNNVYVNSINFGYDPKEWIRSLPLDKVVQLHVAGHEKWTEFDLTLDTHGASVIPEVVELMQWTIQQTGPLPVLLERDANIPNLRCLLEEVALLSRAYESALQTYYQNQKNAKDSIVSSNEFKPRSLS